MDVAEDVEFRSSSPHGKEKVLVPHSSVQITPCRAMGDKEINVLRDIRQRFQIGPGRDAVELDSIEFDSPVLQIHYPTRDKVSGARGFLIKDAVVIPRNEDSEFGRYGFQIVLLKTPSNSKA